MSLPTRPSDSTAEQGKGMGDRRLLFSVGKVGAEIPLAYWVVQSLL